jgi:hypothetical protein
MLIIPGLEWQEAGSSSCKNKLSGDSPTKDERVLLAKDCRQIGDWRRDRPRSTQDQRGKPPNE